MTSEDETAADRYDQGMRENPEVEVDGYGESGPENRGITKVRHVLIVTLAAVLALGVGATGFAAMNWAQTRPNPTVRTLNAGQHQVLLAAADQATRGFNDGAIGAIKANGFEPVAESVDHNTDTFYVVLVKCSGDYVACAKQVKTSPDPVVYLGIPDELPNAPTVVRFVAAKVQVDFPLTGNHIQRCAIYRGKALAGEPGPVTYNLYNTLVKLRGFAGGRTFVNESPDDDASFWSCEPVKRG